MSLTAEENERNRKNGERKEESACSKALIPPVSQSAMDENCELSSGRNRSGNLRNLAASFLKHHNIDEDVKKAIESGDIDNYCNELAKKLEESANATGTILVKRVLELTEQAVAFLREEKERKELGKTEDTESFKIKFKALPEQAQKIVNQTRDYHADIEALCNSLTTAIKEDALALPTTITEEVQRIAENVSVAAKAVCSKNQEIESNTTRSLKDEAVTSLDEAGGEGLVTSESSENGEKPPIAEQEDEHVIPTPPSPPPVKLHYRDKMDEIKESILGYRKCQVKQVKMELNFALARLTSEVIRSYEQTTALQKQNAPSLEKSILDFMQNQETKKTFFIKEISTRMHKVLSMLTPEPEINDPNMELQDLNETVKLLYLLQTTRKYHVDRVAVTTTANEKIGVLFYLLLLLTVFVVVLALSLNREWIALIIFVSVVFIFMVKSWQGMFSVRKKKVEVFGKVKKSVKID